MCECSPTRPPRQPGLSEWRAFSRDSSSVCYAPAGPTGAGAPLSEVQTHQLFHDRPLFDKAANDAEGVVDGALRLFNHQLVGASHHDAHRLPEAGAARDLRGGAVRRRSEALYLVLADILKLTFTSFPEPSRLTSSANSAAPNISGVKWSMWAMGLVPIVWREHFTFTCRHSSLLKKEFQHLDETFKQRRAAETT